jgi:hypothetical protein
MSEEVSISGDLSICINNSIRSKRIREYARSQSQTHYFNFGEVGSSRVNPLIIKEIDSFERVNIGIEVTLFKENHLKSPKDQSNNSPTIQERKTDELVYRKFQLFASR